MFRVSTLPCAAGEGRRAKRRRGGGDRLQAIIVTFVLAGAFVAACAPPAPPPEPTGATGASRAAPSGVTPAAAPLAGVLSQIEFAPDLSRQRCERESSSPRIDVLFETMPVGGANGELCLLGFGSGREVKVGVEAPDGRTAWFQFKTNYRGYAYVVWASDPSDPIGTYTVTATQDERTVTATFDVVDAGSPAMSSAPTASPAPTAPLASPLDGNDPPPAGVEAMVRDYSVMPYIHVTCARAPDGEEAPAVVAPASIEVGEQRWICLRGFRPGEPVAVRTTFPDGHIRTDEVPADDYGIGVWGWLSLPGEPRGTVRLAASQADLRAEGAFDVVDASGPRVWLLPEAGPPGTDFRVFLAGFAQGRPVVLHLYRRQDPGSEDTGIAEGGPTSLSPAVVARPGVRDRAVAPGTLRDATVPRGLDGRAVLALTPDPRRWTTVSPGIVRGPVRRELLEVVRSTPPPTAAADDASARPAYHYRTTLSLGAIDARGEASYVLHTEGDDTPGDYLLLFPPNWVEGDARVVRGEFRVE